MRSALILGLAATTALSVPALANPNDGNNTKTSGGEQKYECVGSTGNTNTVALTGPQVLFPPNHKMVDESVTATDGGSTHSGMTSLTLYTASVDDVAGGDGPDQEFDSSVTGTNADTDKDGVVVTTYQVRAERSGKGDGRTYTIDWAASFDDGTMCGSNAPETPNPLFQTKPAFTITVPHDQGKGND